MAIGGGLCYYHHLKNSPPKKWRRVGELSDLVYYPIKSCGPIRVNQLECTQLGLNDNGLRDRTFMIITPERQFITARAHPKVVQIQPRFEGGKMILSAPSMPDITVDYQAIKKNNAMQAVVWGEAVDTLDCGDELEKWLSKFILGKDMGLRLVFYFNTAPTRGVRAKNRIFSSTKNDTGALHDATSFMLMNEKSLEDLNSKLETPVTVDQFRANFFVKGPAAFEEDNWKWVRIGNVVMNYCQPCTRCIFTNIDPTTAERHPDGQPLKTLKAYRKFEETGESPVMGVHLGVKVPGFVKLGDPVYVEV